MKQLLRKRNGESEEYWISISDLMSGLMVIFLFVALSYMIEISKANEDMTTIAVTYMQNHVELYEALLEEFRQDLPRWNAELDSVSLVVRFKEPEVLFKAGEATLQDRFKLILDDFFPRYLIILTGERFRESIKEIRIEGHTSSEWNNEVTGDQAYFNNMWLSQNRVSSVLDYTLRMPWQGGQADWMKQHVVSNGYSSSRLIRNKVGREDRMRSRRVEFRVVTNADERIKKIVAIGLDNEH